MENDEKERFEMNEEEVNVFVYTLEIVKVALIYGWDIKIFRYDPRLIYLREVLNDNGISPNIFLDLNEFCRQNNVKSSYEWARAVHKKVFGRYDIKDFHDGKFFRNLETLDIAYNDRTNPFDVFTGGELIEFDLQCAELIDLTFSTKFSSSTTDQ